MNRPDPTRQSVIHIVLFGLIVLLYVVAIFSTFKPRTSDSGRGELVAFVLTFVGGSAAFMLGYASVVNFGGRISLSLIEFSSRLNGSRHVLEVKQKPQENSRGLVNEASLFYIPALVFVISLALALNVHYLHTTTDITFPPLLSYTLRNALNTLDIFIKPVGIGSLRYSIEIIPIMLLIVALAGVVPSIVLPYLRKFKVTGINSVPFQRNLLLGVVGSMLGLSIVFSLVDIIYGALTGNHPHYYSYALPTLLGFSLHHSLGTYVGRQKAEEMIEKTLRTESGKRVFQGKISIEKLSTNKEQERS